MFKDKNFTFNEYNSKNNYFHVITGPMFAGKTGFLIKEINNFKKLGWEVLVLKPAVDNRFAKDRIVCHSGQSEFAVSVKHQDFEQSVTNLLKKENYKVLAIDEFHFFSPQIIPFLEKLLQKYTILVSGLNKGVFNNNLEIMNQILTKADYISRLNGQCQNCQQLGTQIVRIDSQQKPSSNPEFVGGSEKYRLLCRSCSGFWKNK